MTDPFTAHGELIKGGPYSHGRWCDVCDRPHGFLYPCEHYSEETLAEIKRHPLDGVPFDDILINALRERGTL